MHYRMLLPILIHASPILLHALPILIHWLGFRLSAPYLNTLNRHDSSRQPIIIEHGKKTHQLRQPIRIEYYVTRVVSQSESSTEKNPSTSSANQNQPLRNPSRQPIRIEHYVTRVEYYVTRELSARVGSL